MRTPPGASVPYLVLGPGEVVTSRPGYGPSQPLVQDLEFIDSHFHLEMVLDNFHFHSFDFLEASIPNHSSFCLLRGVANFVFPPFDVKISKLQGHPRLVYTVGIHPSAVRQCLPLSQYVPQIEHHLVFPTCVGIGELGFDYTKSTPVSLQRDCLQHLLPLARCHDKVLVLHARSDTGGFDTRAVDDLLAMLRTFDLLSCRIHLHCFTYSRLVAEQWMAACPSVCFGFTASVLRGGHLAEVARSLPIARSLLETDSPFLSPPGTAHYKNHPWNILPVAQHIARLRNMPVADFLTCVNANACNLYRFPC